MKKLRRVFPWLLMIWPYLICLGFLFQNETNDEVPGGFILGYVVLTVIVYALNIWNAFAPWEGYSAQRLAFYDMVVKLVHIPFYLGIFVIGMLLLVIMVVPAFVFLSPFAIMLLFSVDLCLMLTSSMYGISAVLKAVREGILPGGKILSYGIFHCMFVTDVISAVLLYTKIKKAQRHLEV